MKNSKKIVIISPFFFPEPISTGKYNTDLALALSKKGHKVTVLCFHPFYPNWKIKLSNLKLNGIEIIRGGKLLKFTNSNLIRRVVLEFYFAFFVVKNFNHFKNNVDIVIPVFPPSFAFYLALKLIKKDSKKNGIIHDLQEIYSANKKNLIYKILSFFINKVEKKCYQNCNNLIFLSNEMKEVAKNKYFLEESKLIVQYPFISIKKNKTKKLGQILKSDKINIVYSGALGEKQNPQKLYEFFNVASKKIEKSEFHFFSSGEEFEKLKKLNNNQKIKFHNLVHEDNLYELYNRSAVQIVPQKEETSLGSLPSKLPNLLASKCKVLLITDKNSELDIFFRKNNLNYPATCWDINYLVQHLKSLLNENIDFKHQNKVSEDNFSLDSLVKKIL